jgi:butyryl-CoA dehydrogenase
MFAKQNHLINLFVRRSYLVKQCAMSTHVGSSLFTLSESHEMLRKTCRDFADRELKPRAGELDKKHQYPTDLVC